MERRKYKAGAMIAAQSRRSYINFDYNPYFVTVVKKNKLKKKVVDEEDPEEQKSSFVKALAAYKTQSIKLKVESAAIINKFLGTNKGNLQTPRYYSIPVAGYDSPCEGVFIITKGS